VTPTFHISQYDVGRVLGLIVHSGGATVDLDAYTCSIEATRSDGTAITSAVATTDNIGTFETTATMTNKADKYKCQLVIVDENSKRIASLPFDMEVTKAAMNENSEAIEEDASLYQQYTEAVQGAIAEANANIQAEATTRASADSNLQSQINQIVAPSGEAPSAAEVQNARIGANGVTYDTLGSAIRGQVSDLKGAFNICSINEYMCDYSKVENNHVVIEADKTEIKVTGTATGVTGSNVIDSRDATKHFYFEKGNKYYLFLKNINKAKQLIINVFYKETQSSSATVLLSIDTTNVTDSIYSGSFTVPNDFYQFVVSITAMNGVSYSEDFVLSIQNTDDIHDSQIEQNNSIIYLNNRINSTDNEVSNIDSEIKGSNFDYAKLYCADGSTVLNGVTIEKSGTYFYAHGTATDNGAYKIIETYGGFKPYDEIYIDYIATQATYLQVIVKETSSSAESALLSTADSGHYKITFPAQVYYTRIAFVFLNNNAYNNEILLSIGRYSFDGRRMYYTSQFSNSLIRTVKEAQKHYGSIVILDNNQPYNIVNEFIDYYGETFFTEYSNDVVDGWGLTIGNGMTLHGLSDTVINCDCSAYNTYNVYRDFSPLMLSGDCTLENLTINAKNTKYCVHDDWFIKTLKAKHEYKNCKMYKYGLGIRCIGGGLTNASEIIIKDCIFDMQDTAGTPINYHNCVNAGAISRGVIQGCYFKVGYPSFSYYGASTLDTEFIVSGNSFAAGSPAIIVPTYEDQTHYTNQNIKVIQFGNEVRSN
jgi:hypothetical protein